MDTNAEYLAGIQLQLKKWDAEVDLLLAQSKKADGEVRTAYARRLKELRLCRKAAQKSFEGLRVATGTAGDKMQAGMQAAWETLQATLAKVTSDLAAMTRKEPAPTQAAAPQAAVTQPAPLQPEVAP